MDIKEISKLYKETFGDAPKSVKKLPGAGSSREYFRILSSESAVEGGAPSTVIATIGKDVMENEIFCRLARVFHEEGAAVPVIFAANEECYLQSDHGDISLMSLIEKWHHSPETFLKPLKNALRLAIDQLVKIQTSRREIFDGPLMAGRFNFRQVKWDLNYFKYNFLKPSGIEPREDALEDDFDLMAETLPHCSPELLTGFMYRDFQSRNILLSPSFVQDANSDNQGVTLIDFQGGREGPMVYDVVSLLWQAKAQFPEDLRHEMLGYYARRVAEERGCAVDEVEKSVFSLIPRFVVFRTLQVLGAYGFRGLVEKKAHFIESIAMALENLDEIIHRGWLNEYPTLEYYCRQLVAGADKYAGNPTGQLRIEVFSFSYKKGYPADWSGNGGGFMFDCRGMHNPGRYEEYKALTGRDKEVIDFLEEKGEVRQFLEAARMMTEPAVEAYLRRGFTNLQIGFGCTGGRHRSVYCAEHLARHLAGKFPEALVVLTHREQRIKEFLT